MGNSKSFLISCCLISFFIFDISKAESDDLSNDNSVKIEIDKFNSKASLEKNNLNSENLNRIFENSQNKNEINIDYLDPKNVLEDYMVDTGDSLLIEFKNKPRGLGLFEEKYDTDDVSYLNPRNNLKNYKLDEGDVLDIKFLYVPEFNSIQNIDENNENVVLPNFRQYPINQEGEIYLPELGSVYVKGLNIFQLKNLLEKKYDNYLKFTDMEIRINEFRFMESGIYSINTEGELLLPLINETYVRGLTTNEISNLLSKKYFNSENINTEVTVRIETFKAQRILISGEVRNPGVFTFPGYSASNFLQNQTNTSESMLNEINAFNTKQSQSISLVQNDQSNNTSQNLQIKRASENFTTISNAIREAGGITSTADLTRIEIIRDIPIGKGGGKKRAVVDFTSFLNENDPSNDIRLFDGDRIFLPKLASASPDIIPKSILTGLSPKFITVNINGRIENSGQVMLPIEASLSDAINLTGPIKPLSGKIVLIRYNKDGTILNKKISYSARAKKGSRRNPYLKEGDLISVTNSFLGKSTGVIKEITAPFVGIYSTKQLIDGFSD